MESSRKPGSKRIRNFTADDLFAFSVVFILPIAWFFLPPDPEDIAEGGDLEGLSADYWIETAPVPGAVSFRGRPLDLLLSATQTRVNEEIRQRLKDLLRPRDEGGLLTPEFTGDQPLEQLISELGAGAAADRLQELEAWKESLTDIRDYLSDITRGLGPTAAMLDEIDRSTKEDR